MDVRHLQVVIARHGNTFDLGDTVLRCGARTDLPLSVSGRLQANALGQALSEDFAVGFDEVFVSQLQRTQQTAEIALAATGIESNALRVESFLNEVDYGPDEGLPESAVVARLGHAALKAWDEHALVPAGWLCDPAAIAQAWQHFLARMVASDHRRVLVITSNGIARFALRAEYADDGGDQMQAGKLSTGAYGVLQFADNKWQINAWNLRPKMD